MRRSATFRALVVFALSAIAASGAAADEIQFSGESTSIELAEGRERTVLSGNARIVSETTRIEASEIELYGEDFRYAQASGSVTAVDEEEEVSLEAERIFYDRQTEILRAEGDVTMEDNENDLVVRAGFVEYRKQEGISIIQLGVRIFGEDFTARSEFARYRRGDNVVELSGLPVVFWKDDEYSATRIVVNLDTDEIALEGEVRGSVVTEEEQGGQDGGGSGGASGSSDSTGAGSQSGGTGSSGGGGSASRSGQGGAE